MTLSALPFEAEVLLCLTVLIVFFVTAAYLVLPGQLREASHHGAYRRDGTLSPRRRQIERTCRLRFAADAMGVIVLASLPILFSAFAIHQWIVPADLAIEAIGRFHPDPDVFRARVEDDKVHNVREAHTKWAERERYSAEGVKTVQATAWHAWPIIAMAMLLLSVVSIWFLVTAINRLVKRFQRSLTRRLCEYRECDLFDEQNGLHESPG